MIAQVHQGDVVWLDPDPTRGSEQTKSRPFVIVSIDQMNAAPIEISIGVPLTRTAVGSPLHVRIEPPEGGLENPSYAMPEHMRSVSHERISRKLGRVKPATLTDLLERCRLLISEPR